MRLACKFSNCASVSRVVGLLCLGVSLRHMPLHRTDHPERALEGLGVAHDIVRVFEVAVIKDQRIETTCERNTLTTCSR